MSNIHFFTGEQSIQNVQVLEESFGKQNDDGADEVYNLESKFKVAADAPAFAITKSLVLAVQDATNSNQVNIALLPINSYSAGFPVKLFIYRGINKSSLVDGSDKIKIHDGTWSGDNILKVINELYAKINNVAVPTVNTVSGDSLGLHFGSVAGDPFLEAIFYDDTDDFHPIIVDAGCQIGKFIGGTNLCGIEVVLDTIGYEPKLSTLKSSSHKLQLPKLVLGSGLTEIEKLTLRFNNRTSKEEVLSYLDITAFYGSCKNQDIRVNGTNNGNDFLTNFYNKNTVYIDIRDDRGFSYNHFFKYKDSLAVGFYSANTSIVDPVYTDMDYYLNWPILKLNDQVFNTGKKDFYVKLPISIGSPVKEHIISSYTGKIATKNRGKRRSHINLSYNDRGVNIPLNNSEEIKLNNWKYNDNKLGSNYFLIKKNTIETQEVLSDLDNIWHNILSLKMNPLFGFDNIEAGEFRINTYTSINNPIINDKGAGVYYYPTVGIAVDMYHVTFFTMREELVFKQNSFKEKIYLPLTGKGKFKVAFDSTAYSFSEPGQNVGFLNQIVNPAVSKAPSFGLVKHSFEDPEDASNLLKFITYAKRRAEQTNDELFDSFETITFTHSEYNALKARQDLLTGSFPKHPKYISCVKGLSRSHFSFEYSELDITTGEPVVVENTADPSLSYISQEINQTVVLDGGNPITLTVIN